MAAKRRGRDARRSAFCEACETNQATDAGDGDGATIDLSAETVDGLVDEITWYMREHKVSRLDLAGAMGVSPGQVSQILFSGESLTPRTLGSVLAALGARVEITLRPVSEHAPA